MERIVFSPPRGLAHQQIQPTRYYGIFKGCRDGKAVFTEIDLGEFKTVREAMEFFEGVEPPGDWTGVESIIRKEVVPKCGLKKQLERLRRAA